MLSELAGGPEPTKLSGFLVFLLLPAPLHGYREWKDGDRGLSIWAPCASSMKHRAACPCPRGFSACAQGPRHFLWVTAPPFSAAQRWFHGKGVVLAPPSLPNLLTAATSCSSPFNHDMPRHTLLPSPRVSPLPKLLCVFFFSFYSLLTATSCFELFPYCPFRPPNTYSYCMRGICTLGKNCFCRWRNLHEARS